MPKIRSTHPHALPSRDWTVTVDGDLAMQGEAIVQPAQFSPSNASYAEACANIELAAAAPRLLAALQKAEAALAKGTDDYTRSVAMIAARAAIEAAGGERPPFSAAELAARSNRNPGR